MLDRGMEKEERKTKGSRKEEENVDIKEKEKVAQNLIKKDKTFSFRSRGRTKSQFSKPCGIFFNSIAFPQKN
jgi:hypothetical protein